MCGAHLAYHSFERTAENHYFEEKSSRFLSRGFFEFALRYQARLKVLSIRRVFSRGFCKHFFTFLFFERKQAVVSCSVKMQGKKRVSPIFDGEKEAKLIALACSRPPPGHARWTLRLLEHKVVELNIVDAASDSTIGRVLKKTSFSLTARNNG